MEKDGTWGDHVIPHAATDSSEICIHLISSLLDHQDLSAQKVMLQFILVISLLQSDRMELLNFVHGYLLWANYEPSMTIKAQDCDGWRVLIGSLCPRRGCRLWWWCWWWWRQQMLQEVISWLSILTALNLTIMWLAVCWTTKFLLPPQKGKGFNKGDHHCRH